MEPSEAPPPRQPRRDSLDAWHMGLAAAGFGHEWRGDLQVSKAARFARLRELDLLCTPVVTVPLDTFFAAPDDTLALVPGARLVAFVDAVAPPGLRLSMEPIERERLADELRAALRKRDPSELTVTMLKAYEVLFNGNIVVRRDGEMFGEFTAGYASPSQQRVEILCRVLRDPYLDIFRYTSDDEFIRRSVYRAIAALPGWGEGRERAYLPGYYEVAIGRDDESGRIVPIFYDYRDARFFIG